MKRASEMQDWARPFASGTSSGGVMTLMSTICSVPYELVSMRIPVAVSRELETHYGRIGASVRQVSQRTQHHHACHDQTGLAFDLDEAAQLREQEVDLRHEEG